MVIEVKLGDRLPPLTEKEKNIIAYWTINGNINLKLYEKVRLAKYKALENELYYNRLAGQPKIF